MGYIRDNEDYYVSLGYTPFQANKKVSLDKADIDYGYCNPIKAKLAAEEEESLRDEKEE